MGVFASPRTDGQNGGRGHAPHRRAGPSSWRRPRRVAPLEVLTVSKGQGVRGRISRAITRWHGQTRTTRTGEEIHS
jgi:hypothetical protein